LVIIETGHIDARFKHEVKYYEVSITSKGIKSIPIFVKDDVC